MYMQRETLQGQLKREAEQIVQDIRDMKLRKKPIDLSKLEAFANRLGGHHTITTWMLDEVEALGVDIAGILLKQYEQKKQQQPRFNLAKRDRPT